MVQRREAWRAGDADHHPRRDAQRRAEEDHHRSRSAAASLHGVADATGISPGRRRAGPRGDVLAGGKNSRLYKRLVYDMQIAQNCRRIQNSQGLSSYFLIRATPQPGHTPEELKKVIDEEIVQAAARAADRPRSAARDQPDRIVVLQPDGARRRLLGQGRSAERGTTRTPATPTGSTKTSRATARCPDRHPRRRAGVPARGPPRRADRRARDRKTAAVGHAAVGKHRHSNATPCASL